jgi:predicted amidohydrolase YtcJ
MKNALPDQNGLAPDSVILNAVVRTMDPEQPLAGGVAVFQGHIAAVGASDEIQALAGPGTRVIDAEGRLVLPGFNDAHVHFLMGGFSLQNVDLRSSRNPDELTVRLREYAATLPPGRWITGGDWDHEKWPGSPLPTRQWIDAFTPANPVFIHRLDAHMALANSVALRLAGIDQATPDPPGGLIVRDTNTGEPTGLVKDSAMDLITRMIPPATYDEKYHAARAASHHAASLGVTSVTDVSADEDIGLYQEMAKRGDLVTRIYGTRSIVAWETLGKTGIRCPFGDRWVRNGGLKGFSDGSLGSTTALFFEPYADAPETSGLLFDQMMPEGIMLERVRAADRAGLQIMIHAIGDKANAIILDLYEQVARENGSRDRRFRIEHAQHLRPQDIPRFGRHQVIASMQPYHAADDGRWCGKRLGTERSQGAYAFRSLLDTGAILAFGTDWTVAPLDPLPAIKAAVTRQTLDGGHPGGWNPEQKITVEEAVRAYTMGSAFAEFAEDFKGSISVGKLADLVILDRDVFAIDPSQIDEARVSLTMVDGKVVYEAENKGNR